MSRLEINIGDKFNKLTVIKHAPSRRLPSGQINRFVLCKCDCGEEKEVRLLHLVRDRIKSCGCLRVGMKLKSKNDTYLRIAWRSMYWRVSKKSNSRKNYYDKGIIVCDEWKDFRNFYKWAKNNGLKEGLQIDRIDSKGNYSPDNCRVVTAKQNCNNRYNTFFVTYNGIKVAFTDVLEDKGLMGNYGAIRGRILRGWDEQKAIDTPIRKGNYFKKPKV